MRVCFISDTHGFHEKIKIPECDILVHCGDFSSRGIKLDTSKFLHWFSALPIENKIFICGNHDVIWEDDRLWIEEILRGLSPNTHYLQDSGIEINGIKFWGSPWQPEFCNWAFNLPRSGDALNIIWNKIPRDTDILITHTPLSGILDKCNQSYPPYPQNAGCELLRHRVEEIGSIKVCASGHVHEGYGSSDILSPTLCINCSICDLHYNPVNKPVLLDI